ncbi:hypothetical protein DFH28DRAFT_953530 [Melampsora americana]|nr:hypothetical protein DFH28DRAFT_953530 [Melampsora americana]
MSIHNTNPISLLSVFLCLYPLLHRFNLVIAPHFSSSRYTVECSLLRVLISRYILEPMRLFIGCPVFLAGLAMKALAISISLGSLGLYHATAPYVAPDLESAFPADN